MASGEQPIQPDCGTPKECRAEQREKDDLIAQQTAAEAARSQRDAAWWQVGLSALGVILLITTLLYTHNATRAALKSVELVTASERARLSICHGPGFAQRTLDGTVSFKLMFTNTGKTTARVTEVAYQILPDNKFSSFKDPVQRRYNRAIPAGARVEFDSATIPNIGEGVFLAGYCKYETVFSRRLLTDYFVMKADESIFGFGEFAQGEDWPPDE